MSALDSFSCSDYLVLELGHDGKNVAFRDSERDGCATSADEVDGKIQTALLGSSPQGESDTLNVCRTLVMKLGKPWAEPLKWREQYADVDCYSINVDDEKDVLLIQVVRASSGKDLWYTLANAGRSEMTGTPEELAGEIFRAVKKKSDRTQPTRRPKLVLAMDASRLAGFNQESVVKTVMQDYGLDLSLMGFRAIWLVGPTVSRTFQLA